MSTTTQYLRLAAALFAYDRAMREHIVEQMEKLWGDQAKFRIVKSLSDERQDELDYSEGDSKPISNLLEIKDFRPIVSKHRNGFDFDDDKRKLIAKIPNIRNRVAHPGGRIFEKENVDGRVQQLAELVRVIDEERGDEIVRRDQRILAAEKGGTLPSEPDPGTGALRAEFRKLLGKIEEDGAKQIESILARLDATEEKRAEELQRAVSAAASNADRIGQLLEEIREERQRARQEREEAQKIREQHKQAAAKQAGNARPEPVQPSPQMNRVNSDEMGDYRDSFVETSNGNGWKRVRPLDGWFITRWVGNSHSGLRACVFPPSRGQAKAGELLIQETCKDEDAAFRLLYEAEQSGEIESRAKKAIAEYESRQKPEAGSGEDEVPF